ncbi:LysR family transcriptional regulator [Verminephrobacter aporrectodeae]|uniref:LysR family transcriptional regulator n=1 Tax=Verminephrobacter aporrectodeae TaxID=1110389 RepID=UPI00224313D5|nr:LysR family transcriptional regulator [Verminephrobacter aporrectodeae]
MKSTMNLNLLAALDALLAEGSVSGAAKRMHVSTPAMSHTLARIREATGDQILVRAGRRFVPTVRAQEMRAPVRKLVEEAVALLSPGDAGLIHVERTFVVRAPDGVSIVFGAALAGALQEVMPSARLRFIADSDGDLASLREGQVDLDIGAIHDRGQEIETELLFEQSLLGAVRKGHPMLAAGPMTLERFAAERHVAVLHRGKPGSPIDGKLAEVGQQRFVVLTVPSPYAALMAAARSDLVATAPARFAQSVQRPLHLTTFQLPLQLAPERVAQAWHPRFSADPAHRWLRGCIRDLLSTKTWPQAPL